MIKLVSQNTLPRCRAGGQEDLELIMSFGNTPLADALLTESQLGQPEYFAPLELAFSPSSALVQITQSVPPEILFCRSYPYYSSVSPSLMEHFCRSALAILQARQLGPQSLVIEAASNDGYMLRNFVKAGIPVLGIDPASGPVAAAREAGISTMEAFFNLELAQQLAATGQRADLFLANNVLAHVPDLNGFVAGIHTVLKPTGIAVIEVPYVVDLVDRCEFDTIYHQHLCYFSVTALDRLFRQHQLYLNRVERTQIHGGSLRLFVEPQAAVESSVRQLLQMEACLLYTS
ncbi:methyltransferase, partial [filamentous cyanobacterium CCP5]